MSISSKKEIAFWKKNLEGANFVLELPKTSLQLNEERSKRDVVHAHLSPALTQRLQVFAKKRKTDLFHVLQSGFAGFLFRYTRQGDFTFGYPVVQGGYVSVVPIRFEIQSDRNFEDLLKHTLTWERSIKGVKIKETHSNEPLFNVYFSMEDVTGKKPVLTTKAPKSDLSLLIAKEKNKIRFCFEFPICLQDRKFIERMAKNFQIFLSQLITHPKKKIGFLQLLTREEKQKLLKLAPGPKTAYPRQSSVVAVFEKIAAKYPKNIAMRFLGKEMSYKELNEKANQLARHLKKMGVKRQDFVGIYLERSIDLFVGILAILKAGAIYVPIDASYPLERKLYMIKDTGLKVLITAESFAEQFPKKGLRFLFLKDIDLTPYPKTNLKLKIKALDLAYINYTSGTTGNPKGVQIYHRGINRLVIHPNWANFSSHDRFLQVSNISYDGLVHELWGAFLNGATLCIYPQIKLSPDELGKFIEKEKVTQIVFTSRLFTLMVEESLEYLKGVRCICSGGDAMSAKHAKIAFEKIPSCQVTNVCGPTENATQTTTYAVVDPKALKFEVPIGRPIGHTSVYVLDANRQLVPFGANGELCTGGDGLAKGYLHRPDLTAEKFIPNPFGKGRLYRIGDLVHYLPDGNLSFLGRIDTQVKIRGFRIELGEVEEVIRAFSGVSDCIAMAREDVPGNKQLVAYVQTQHKKKVDAEGLKKWVASKLPSFMIPSFFVILERFPMTPNGKVDRKSLKPPASDQAKESTFKTETEKAIGAIWLQILHRKSIDRNDHFFKIGGDSIHAMQAISQIKRSLQCEISAGALFENPVLADLAKKIDSLKKSQVEAIPRRSIFSPVPLSLNQESLWLIDKLNPHSKLQYMVLNAYRLKGKVDSAKLKKSLEKIIDRHEILRTRFVEQNGKTLQKIEPASRNFFVEMNGKDERCALALMQEKLAVGMDLTQLPLFQVLLIKVRSDLHFLGIRAHHILFDILSYENLFKEWIAFYTSKPVPTLPIQYADYALWQRKWVESKEVQNQLGFWKKQLSGAPELLELPWDKPRPPLFFGNGDNETALFSITLSNELKELAKKEGVTLYVLLFAAFQVLLHRLIGKGEIVVGTPYANRTRQELDPLIGYFLQMLVVRSDCAINPAFNTFLSQLNHTMSECYKNSDIPLEMIVNALNPARDPSFNPLFQTLFVYESITGSFQRFADVELEEVHLEIKTAKFDLSLFIYDRDEGLECRFEYCTDLFEKQTIQRMLSHFHTLLKGIVEKPGEKIAYLPILSRKEESLITIEWNKTGSKYPQNQAVPALFEEMVKKFPETQALRFEGKSMSYRQLNERGNQVARHLQKLGVQKQDFIGVYLERSDDLIVVILGILKAGAVYVPIDASYPMERKLYMIEHTGLKVLISHPSFANQFPKEKLHFISFNPKDFTTYDNSNLKMQIDPQDLAYINYTSGSTGNPKGVEYTHLGIVRLLKNPTWMDIVHNDRMLQISNISFDMLAAEVWGALLNGATLCIYPQTQFSPQQLGQFLVDEKVSHLYLTARLFVLMVEEGLEYMKNIRFFSSTGDVMSAHHAKVAFEKLAPCQIVNAYGPTENHITTTYTVNSSTPIVPIGVPVQGTQVYILDSHFHPVPIGVHGELCIGGDGLARGYLNNQRQTDEKFIPNPFGKGKLYRTGDLVCYLPDGNIKFLGRIDTQVKILGFRIELDEVEEVIREYPKISDCIAIAKETDHNEKHLVVYIEPKEGEKPIVDEIRAFVVSKLPKHSVPSYIVLLDKFPLTPNGKIDKRKLPLPTAGLEQRAFNPPVTPTEKRLASIWSDLLKISKINRQDNFFHLGGHSILAMQLNSLAKKAFEIEIPVSLIFEHSTLEKYADSIDQIQRTGVQLLSVQEPFVLWRDREAVLDPSIDAKGIVPVAKTQYTHPKKIFLTGVTGFVGAFFLKTLIEKTEAKIYCLCRAKSKEEGLQRIIETLTKYLIWKPNDKNRIEVVPGYLEEPLLGIQPDYFQKLGSEIDSIFHIGAFVNHAMSYEQHKRANVFGTQEVLKLATTHRLKPLYFISTVAVVSEIKKKPVPEDIDIEKNKDITNGYVESKWVGEKLIFIARSRGVPCTIFRLPRVSGDSKIGSGPTIDFFWRLIQASLNLKMAPEVDLYDDLTPVDYICQAMLTISANPKSINSQFHVIGPAPFFYRVAFKFLKELRYSFKLTPFNKWKKTLVDTSIQTGDHQLQALASLLADIDLSHPTPVLTLGSDRLHAALKGSGLKCPTIDLGLFKKYVDYYVKIGYLPPRPGSK